MNKTTVFLAAACVLCSVALANPDGNGAIRLPLYEIPPDNGGWGPEVGFVVFNRDANQRGIFEIRLEEVAGHTVWDFVFNIEGTDIPIGSFPTDCKGKGGGNFKICLKAWEAKLYEAHVSGNGENVQVGSVDITVKPR